MHDSSQNDEIVQEVSCDSLDKNMRHKQLKLINDFYYCRPGKGALSSNTCSFYAELTNLL